MRVIQEERNGDSVFRSSPEELFLILPKYPADKAARKKILAGKLNEIALVVPIKHRKGEASTPSDLILTAAQRGFIHPLEGQRLLKELDFFQTKENIDNSWTVSDPAPIHKTPVTPQESTKETPKPQ